MANQTIQISRVRTLSHSFSVFNLNVAWTSDTPAKDFFLLEAEPGEAKTTLKATLPHGGSSLELTASYNDNQQTK